MAVPCFPVGPSQTQRRDLGLANDVGVTRGGDPMRAAAFGGSKLDLMHPGTYVRRLLCKSSPLAYLVVVGAATRNSTSEHQLVRP